MLTVTFGSRRRFLSQLAAVSCAVLFVSIMSPVEIILTVITAAGGSAIVVAGLAAWLGKVWADRIADALAEVLSAKSSGVVSDADYEKIRKCCSTLRSALADDIESRREGPA